MERVLAGRKVLAVDDNRDCQMLLNIVLERSGAYCSVAETGQEAIRLALAEDFDVILLDLCLPDLDGYEVTSQLRAAGCLTPILIVSANAFSYHRQKAIQVGASGYITKPFDINSFAAMIERLIKKSVQLAATD